MKYPDDPATAREKIRHRTRLVEFLGGQPQGQSTVAQIRDHFTPPSDIPLYNMLMLSLVFHEGVQAGTLVIDPDTGMVGLAP